MKLKNKNSSPSKLKIIVITILILAVLAGGAVAAYSIKTSSDTTKQKQAEKVTPEGINYNTPTTEQQAAGSTQKANAQDTPPPATQTIGVSITALNQSNGLVQVRTLIDSVTNSASCTITLTKNSSTVTKQSGTQAGPSSSTCKGFDIPTSELSVGDWQMVISVKDGASSGSVSKVLTVK